MVNNVIFYIVTKMDRYNKYQTMQYTHNAFARHTQHIVASTWLGGYHSTKEDHLLVRLAHIRYTWRIIKFYLLTFSLNCLGEAYFWKPSNMKATANIVTLIARVFCNIFI